MCSISAVMLRSFIAHTVHNVVQQHTEGQSIAFCSELDSVLSGAHSRKSSRIFISFFSKLLFIQNTFAGHRDVMYSIGEFEITNRA